MIFVVLAIVGWVCAVGMLGRGIAEARKMGMATTSYTDFDSADDGPLQKSGVHATPTGVGAGASTFSGKSKSVRVSGSFTPADAAEHPRVAFLLMGGFCLAIASFGLLFWGIAGQASEPKIVAAAMWLIAAFLPIGYYRRIQAEKKA